MKKLMFFALAAASLALPASIEVLDLKKGLTAPEFSTGVRAIERIEAVSFVDNATLTVKRIRGLVDIPYMSHLTNDGAAVGWKVLDGTTYSDVNEGTRVPYWYWGGTDDEEIVFYTNRTAEARTESVTRTEGYGWHYDRSGNNVRDFLYEKYDGWYVSWTGQSVTTNWTGSTELLRPEPVYYLFASNALFASSVGLNPSKWVKLGFDHKFQYFPSGTYYKIRNHQYTDERITGPFIREITTPVQTVTYYDDVYTNWVWQSQHQYQVVSRIPHPVFDGIPNNDLRLDYEYYKLSEIPDQNNRMLTTVLKGVDLPERLYVSDSLQVDVGFLPGHVVTNFAVWSTFSTQATNVFYTATMGRGSVVSTNFVNAGYLLPGDRMVVEGTALPTGQVKMYLNSKE